MIIMNKISSYGPILVRVAMSLVFLWFGANQLMHAASWTSVVPGWAAAAFGGASTVVLLNGWFEIVAGLMLLAGFHTRVIALLLGLHLIGIAGGFGLSALGVRDWGLCLATLSIFFTGPDIWCIDRKLSRDFAPIQSSL